MYSDPIFYGISDLLTCAPWKGTASLWVRTPPGELSLQPEAIGAATQGRGAEAFGVEDHHG